MAAAMTGTATVTGKIGPELTATAVVIRNVEQITYDLFEGVVSIFHDNGQVNTFQLSNMVTITMTISGTTLTTTLTT